MADIINLRTARKRTKRRLAEEDAAANRLAHGVGKDQRQANDARRDKAARDLDQHRRDKGDR
jgi:hypothetical protein